MRKCWLILMLLVVAACSGPDNKNTCIPTRGEEDEKALDGSQMASMSKLEEELENAKIITTIVTKIKEAVVGDNFLSFSGAEKLFTGFVQSDMVQTAVATAIALYVIIFGVLLVGGMVNLTIGEIVIRSVKVIFVSIFALNWSDFYDLIGQASMNFTDEMLGYFLDNFSAKFSIGGVSVNITQDLFGKLDYFVAKVFGPKMMALLSALMFAAGPSGPIYALLILMAVAFTFKAIIHVVLVYCFSLFARAMLFAVAPIFLTFLLFKPTFSLFESWMKQVINYSLQPVLVGAFLGFFLAVMQPFFQEFLKYQFCWMAVDSTREQYGWVFIDPSTGNRVDFGASSKPAIEIKRILVFLGFGYIFYSSGKLGAAMASGLTGTVAGNLSDAAKGLGGVGNYISKGNSTVKNLVSSI